MRLRVAGRGHGPLLATARLMNEVRGRTTSRRAACWRRKRRARGKTGTHSRWLSAGRRTEGRTIVRGGRRSQLRERTGKVNWNANELFCGLLTQADNVLVTLVQRSRLQRSSRSSSQSADGCCSVDGRVDLDAVDGKSFNTGVYSTVHTKI